MNSLKGFADKELKIIIKDIQSEHPRLYKILEEKVQAIKKRHKTIAELEAFNHGYGDALEIVFGVLDGGDIHEDCDKKASMTFLFFMVQDEINRLQEQKDSILKNFNK